MSELTEQLRELAKPLYGTNLEGPVSRLLREAADEIDRLEAENARLADEFRKARLQIRDISLVVQLRSTLDEWVAETESIIEGTNERKDRA